MVQGDHLPLVVEDGGPARSWRRVRLVAQEIFQLVDDLVLPQGQLLGLAVGVLDDVDVLAHNSFALFLDQAVPTELAKGGTAVEGALRYSHQAVVQTGVGEEKGLGLEVEDHRAQRLAREVLLEIELHPAVGRLGGTAKDVVVGKQQPWGNHEPRPEANRLAGGGPYLDPAHGAGYGQGQLQIDDPDQVALADDALESKGAGWSSHRRLDAREPLEPPLAHLGRVRPYYSPGSDLLSPLFSRLLPFPVPLLGLSE